MNDIEGAVVLETTSVPVGICGIILLRPVRQVRERAAEDKEGLGTKKTLQ